MSSWCQEIISSIQDDSSWKASISFPSSIWSTSDLSEEPPDTEQSNSPIQNSTISSLSISSIDIIQLFNQSLKIQMKILQIYIRMNFPKSAIFHFEQYDSLLDEERLIHAIKKSAASTGTYLITKSTKKMSMSKIIIKLI